MLRLATILGLAGLLIWPASCSSTLAPSPPRPDGSLRAVEVGLLDLAPAEALRVVITDSLAFVGCGEDGLRIVDISDPAAPEVVAVVAELRADALSLDDDLLYLLSLDSSWYFKDASSLSTVDVIDPRQPGPVRTIKRALGRPADLSVESSTLALAAGNEGLFLGRGLSDSLTDLTSLLASDSALAVLAGRDRVYAVGRSESFDFWLGYGDVQDALAALDAATFRLLARTELPAGAGGTIDLASTGDRLLLSRSDGLRVITIEPDGKPSRIISVPLPGARAVAADGNLGVVAGTHLALIDLADPALPRLAELSPLDPAARDVAILNRLVVVAAGASGLRLYQVESR